MYVFTVLYSSKFSIENNKLISAAINVRLYCTLQFSSTRPEVNDDPDNVVNSNYYNINEIQSLKVANKNKSLSIFQINACSWNKNFDDLEHLLKCTNKKFDVVAVSESRSTKISRNYVTLISRTTQLSPLQPNHQQEEHYFAFQITCLINLVMT